MAKKHVAVSLRRPPPPADLESLVVAAAAPQLAAMKAEAVGASIKRSRRRAPVAPVAPVAPIALETSAAQANDAELGAASVDSREVVEPTPAPAAHAAHADSFVGHARAAVRTLTLELPTAVADRLLAYCKLHGRDLHEVVAEILARHLAQAEGGAESSTAQALAKLEALVAWVRARLRLVDAVRRRLVELGRMVYAAM